MKSLRQFQQVAQYRKKWKENRGGNRIIKVPGSQAHEDMIGVKTLGVWHIIPPTPGCSFLKLGAV